MLFGLHYAPAYQDSLAFGANYTSPYQSSTARSAAIALDVSPQAMEQAPAGEHECFYCSALKVVWRIRVWLIEKLAGV